MKDYGHSVVGVGDLGEAFAPVLLIVCVVVYALLRFFFLDLFVCLPLHY